MSGLRHPLASRAVFLALAAALVLLATQTARADSNVLFIFDASGSMKKPIDGKPRIDIARQSFVETVLGMPDSAHLGLMIYGARRAKDCTDIDLVSPVGADDQGTLVVAMAGLKAKGETPIADAIIRGARTFAPLKGQNNSIVLLTDGIEECGGDPCAAAAAVKKMGVDLKINIVGFTLDPNQRATIECLAKETGGKYYDAADAHALVEALAEVSHEVVEAPPPQAESTPPPPAPAEQHKLKVLAYLTPDKPYDGVEGVRWDLFRATGDGHEAAPFKSTSTLSNMLTEDPSPGRYVIRASVGLASGETPVEVTADKDANANVVLNAGIVEGHAVATEDKALPSDAARQVRWDITGASGENAGTYGSDYVVVVPAGSWTLQASLGNVDSKVPVEVVAGAKLPAPVALGVGRLVLHAKAPGGTDYLQGIWWRVTGVADGQVVYGENFFTESVFNVAAGEYKVTASLGDATVEEQVSVPVGEVVVRDLVIPSAPEH